jgi:hypothetical protein
LIQAAMAFFCADEPDALIEPVAQLAEPLPDEVLVPPPLSEPQAASASAPTSATAARRAVPVMFTLVLQALMTVLTAPTLGTRIDRIGGRA